MTFFVDNNLSKKLVEGMRGFGEDVVHLTEHFDSSAADSDWLPFIGSKRWFLITRDNRILLSYRVGSSKGMAPFS